MTESLVGQTVETARRALTARFKSGRIDSAELDARILVGATLDLDLTGVIAAASRPLTSEESIRLQDFARRRLSGEPIARILGLKEFWGLPLKLSAATLVPRPDTETVVELALQMMRAAPDRGPRLRIVDIGTGSGAILLALLSELPQACGSAPTSAWLHCEPQAPMPLAWGLRRALCSSPATTRWRCRVRSI